MIVFVRIDSLFISEVLNFEVHHRSWSVILNVISAHDVQTACIRQTNTVSMQLFQFKTGINMGTCWCFCYAEHSLTGLCRFTTTRTLIRKLFNMTQMECSKLSNAQKRLEKKCSHFLENCLAVLWQVSECLLEERYSVQCHYFIWPILFVTYRCHYFARVCRPRGR